MGRQGSPRRGAWLIAGTVGLVLLAGTALAGGGPKGSVSQSVKKAGCISDDGSAGTCEDAPALDNPYGLSVSPDSKYVYVGAINSNAVDVLQASGGGLKPLKKVPSCVHEFGNIPCSDGYALIGVYDTAVRPDRKFVYAVAGTSDSVVTFAKQKKGDLLEVGCVSETGAPAGCTDGKGLDFPPALAVSPDGRNVYVASFTSGGVASFSVDQAAGVLTQLTGLDGCATETGTGGQCRDVYAVNQPWAIALDPDGNNVYVASKGANAITVFTRDPGTGALTQAPGTNGCVSADGTGGACEDAAGELAAPNGLVVSPDGRFLYSVSYFSDSIEIFTRTPDGYLEYAACVNATGSNGCADARGLKVPYSPMISKDGKFLYVASGDTAGLDGGIAVFARDVLTGALTQLPGTAGCISESGTDGCADGRHMNGDGRAVLAPNGKTIYKIGDDAVAVLARKK